MAHLRAALWEALTLAMAPLDAATTAALAERLAFVCDAVAAATLTGAGGAADDVASFRVHDARGDWEGALERMAADGHPFALLAVEADDAPRLVAADADAARARSRASSRPSAASCAPATSWAARTTGACGSSPPGSAPRAPARWPSASPTRSPPWPRCAARR